jgi:hypothetical protein
MAGEKNSDEELIYDSEKKKTFHRRARGRWIAHPGYRLGEVDLNASATLIQALSISQPTTFEATPMGGHGHSA